MPLCILKYPEFNIEGRNKILKEEDPSAVMMKRLPEMHDYLVKATSFDPIKEYIVKFEITDMERILDRLEACKSELVKLPPNGKKPKEIEYVLSGLLRIPCEDLYTKSKITAQQDILPPGHPQAGSPATFYIFGNVSVFPEAKTLKVQAMSHSRYKQLLKLLKDYGAAQYVSAGCLEKAEQLQSVRTVDKTVFDGLDLSGVEKDRTSQAAARELEKLHLATHCAGCGGDAGGKKLLTCSRCKAVYYCGPACQSSDWKGHKKECRAKEAKRV